MYGMLKQQRYLSHSCRHASKRSGLTKLEMLVVLAIVLILLSLLLPHVERGLTPARRVQCRNNLKQISLALYDYHDEYQSFPPAWTVDADGKRLHSWRTLILPYLDQQKLYETIDLSKPWDDPANATAYGTHLHVYQCPSAAELPPGFTIYTGIVGPDRSFHPTETHKLTEFTATSQTLMVTEVSPEDAIHWMAPQDDTEPFLLALNEETPLSHTGGIHTVLADGTVLFISANIERKMLLSLVSITDDKSSLGEY